jgi:hypothetical protein
MDGSLIHFFQHTTIFIIIIPVLAAFPATMNNTVVLTRIGATLLTPGVARFRQLLQDNVATLRQSPVLLVSSEFHNDNNASPTAKHIRQCSDACELVKFTLRQEFGLRTVDTKLGSAFPTLSDVDQRLDLMHRTGAGSIVAVGSGPAMDLAKSVLLQQDSASPLILVPATFGAMVASGTVHSLLLDRVEETLMPGPKKHQDVTTDLETTNGASIATSNSNNMVIPLDHDKYMQPMDDKVTRNTILHLAAAIILDAGIRGANHPLIETLLDNVTQLLSRDTTDGGDHVMTVSTLLFQSAGLLSYGLPGSKNDDERSIPLALMASLLPTIFPQTHPTVFMANLVPGLCLVMKEKIQQQQQQQRSRSIDTDLLPKFELLIRVLEQQHGQYKPPMVVHDEYKGFSIPDMAHSCIESNQQGWNCLDVDMNTLMTVLKHTFNGNHAQ